MRIEPQDQPEHAQVVIGAPYCNRRDSDGLAPIHGLQTGQEALAHAAFEVVHADSVGEMANAYEEGGPEQPRNRTAL